MTDGRSRAYTQRPRMIPPELVNDERVEECSLLAAILAVRVVTLADDQGRLPGSARHVRGVAFAMRSDVSEAQVDEALDELAAAGFLLRYDDGRVYIQVVDWWSLQRLRRAYASRYPAPAGWVDRVFGTTPGPAEDDVPPVDREVPPVDREVPSPRAGGEAKRSEAKRSEETGATKPVDSRSGKPARSRPGSPAHRRETAGLMQADHAARKSNGLDEAMTTEGGFAATLARPTEATSGPDR